MNREIKFRIWSNEHCKMFFSTSCPISNSWITEDGHSLAGCLDYQAMETYGILSIYYRLKKEEYDNVMQFTGLKDKNGKDIYEGDILYLNDDKGPWVVAWNESGFSIHNSMHTEQESHWAYFYPYKESGGWIIKGNIFENQELIK